MKKSIKFLIVALLFLSQNSISQDFTKINQKAYDITISPKDGSVFIVDVNRIVSKLNRQSNKFENIGGAQPKTVKSIEVDKNGKLYMVDISGAVHERVNNAWVKRTGVRTNDIHIDGFGNISVLDLSKNMKRLNYQKQWEDLSNINGGISKPNQVISISSQEYFARGSDNSLKRFWGNKWSNLNGQPLYITLDKKTRIIYAVGRNRGIYKWDMSRQKWNLLGNSTKNFKTIAVHDKMIWGINTKNDVYKLQYQIVQNQNNTTVFNPNMGGQTITSTTSNTQINQGSTPKDYSGTYKVSIKKFGTSQSSEFYGTMGVYLEGKTQSGNIVIKPLDKKTNRYLDISRTKAQKPKGPGILAKNFINGSGTKNYKYAINVDKTREFRLMGDAANKDATFDFQFNIKSKMWKSSLDDGKWERVKIKVSDLVLNKEYTFATTSGGGVTFKIEKR